MVEINVNQKENCDIEKGKTKVKDIFGKLKFKKSTKEILDEIDKELESEMFE